MNSNLKYVALVMELSASILVLGYSAQWLDESYGWFKGYGFVVGFIIALTAWMYRASRLLNGGEDE